MPSPSLHFVHLPPPPGVIPLFLDVLGVSNERDIFSSVPSVQELESLANSIQACASAAQTRSRNARQGVVLGHDIIARGKEKQTGGNVTAWGHGGASARQETVKVKEEPDERRKPGMGGVGEEKKSNRGRGKSHAVRTTQSPTPKLERDASASPAPTEDSHGFFDAGLTRPSKRRKTVQGEVEMGETESGYTGTGHHVGAPGMEVDYRETPPLPTIKLKVNPSTHKNASRPTSDNASSSIVLPSRLASSINFTLPTGTGSSVPWHLPQPVDLNPRATLVPRRQAIPKPPRPGPKRQKDVNVDYSTPKAGAGSINWNTFWNFIEPYLKDIGEDDLAMLRFRSDDPHLFDMPRLGQHYQDVWELEDSQLPFRDEATLSLGNGGAGDNRLVERGAQVTNGSKFMAPRDLTEDDLYDDRRGLGNLTERVVAAILTKRAADDPTRGRSASAPGAVHEEAAVGADWSGGITSDSTMVQMNWNEEQYGSGQLETRWPILPHTIGKVMDDHGHHRPHIMEISLDDLEGGMRRELALLGMLEAEREVDWEQREDDEIAAALRQCQRLLQVQLAVNNARKDRLAGIVRDRLAHAEYKRGLDGLEKVIEAAWVKRGARKGRKGRKRDANNVAAHVPLDDLTKKAIMTRQRWISTIGQALEAPDVLGRYTGLPQKSIFEGVDIGGRGLMASEHVLTS